MEVKFGIAYHPAVVHTDIPSLGHMERDMVAHAISQKLRTMPEVCGKPLRRSLRGCRSLRIGDYRVVFFLKATMVHIVAIEHRSTSYREAEKRVG